MKRDIPEGAEWGDMPIIGYGRILSVERLRERYATVSVGWWRVFVAWGKYGGRGWGWRLWYHTPMRQRKYVAYKSTMPPEYRID